MLQLNRRVDSQNGNGSIHDGEDVLADREMLNYLPQEGGQESGNGDDDGGSITDFYDDSASTPPIIRNSSLSIQNENYNSNTDA